MRAADDFQSIRHRMFDLRRGPRIDPATCPQHSFEPATDRCVYCNLHYYHLPAFQHRKATDADAGNLPCPCGGYLTNRSAMKMAGVSNVTPAHTINMQER